MAGLLNKLNEPEENYGAMGQGDLDNIHSADLNYQNWRYDSAVAEEYFDGNQFDLDATQDANAAGIALTTANWVKKLVNDMRGIQESALTSWKVRGEIPEHQDFYSALGLELFKHARLTNADRHRIHAYAGQLKPGIGWVEVGYEDNPLNGKFFVDFVPWRQMWFDIRANRCDIDDGQWIRRARIYPKEYLKKRFSSLSKIDDLVDAAPAPSQMRWNTFEPDQQYRALIQRRPRDVALAYQNTPKDQDLRMVEEIWYPVFLDGYFCELPNGKVMLYDSNNSMLTMMVKRGVVPLRRAPYKRWRRALWIGDTKVSDIWSPFPWRGHPYIAFFGYREGMTNVPYGVVRDMVSLQDEVNAAAAKFHAGMDQVTVFIEEGAPGDQTTHDAIRNGIGDKRSYVILKDGKLDKIKVDRHNAHNEQQYKRMVDAERQLRETSPLGTMTPGGAPAAPGQMDAMTMRAMAGMGEINGNYAESSTKLGDRLLDLICEDIAKRGDVEVGVQRHDGSRVQVRLHRTIGEHHKFGKIISNDVTMMHMEVALDDVPHTATYRSQQLQDLTKVLQSTPQSASQLRELGASMVIRLMDVPHANEMADMVLKQAGMLAPQTPEEAQAVQQKQQQAQEEREISLQGALAQIAHRKAQTGKLISDAHLKDAMAASKVAELENPAYQEANRRLLLERTAAQNRRTEAQSAKIEKELSAPPEPAPVAPAPAQIPENW